MAIMILWGADKDEKLKESERVLALKALYEVVETEFINEQGKIYEKYLVKNTTEEERKNYIRMPNRIITSKEEWNPFDDYIEGKCTATRRIKEYIHTTIEEILVIDGDFAMFTQLILAVKKRREYNYMAYLKQSHIYTMKYASR